MFEKSVAVHDPERGKPQINADRAIRTVIREVEQAIVITSDTKKENNSLLRLSAFIRG